MKKLFLVATVTLLAAAGSWAQSGTMMKSDPAGTADGTMMKSDSMMKSGGSMMVSDADRKMSADSMDITAFNLKGLGPQVVAFTSEQNAWNLAKTQTEEYINAATWCPDCQATYHDLKANFAALPPNLTLVFVDYDRAADLKTKYGITAQHTFVVVGPLGEKKKVFNGTSTVADIVKTATAM